MYQVGWLRGGARRATVGPRGAVRIRRRRESRAASAAREHDATLTRKAVRTTPNEVIDA
jgi:hypothetical protein